MNDQCHEHLTKHQPGSKFLRRNACALVAAAAAIGLVTSACGSAENSDAKASPAAATQLQSLIPAPANTRFTDGPAVIPDSGIAMHFLVNGSSTDVMDAYETALEVKGWAVTVLSSGGWQGAGGATYTGTQGNSYAVFSGGGSDGTTNIKACAWPSKPSNPNCGSGNRG